MRPSFHNALSPGLKLIHGTEGQEEEEEGECSEHRLISALRGPRRAPVTSCLLRAPDVHPPSGEGGCIIQ